jgi:hypothetical protein
MPAPLQWERVKNVLHQIYIVENSTIEQTRNRLKEYGFSCSKAAFLAQMAVWGFTKHQVVLDTPEVRETIRSLMFDHGFKDLEIQHVCYRACSVLLLLLVRLTYILGFTGRRNLNHAEEYPNTPPSYGSLSKNTKP